MESDANWLLDESGGTEVGGCCISATLRDYARIGLFALHEGQLRDGQGVLPENWMQRSINQFYQATLPRTIGTQNSGRLPKFQVKVDVVEHWGSPEPGFSVSDFQPIVGAQLTHSANVR